MRTLVSMAVIVASFPVSATEYVKTVTLSSVASQATRPIQPSTQNRDFLSFVAGTSWSVNGGSGGGACAEDSAVLPADNAIMRAIALAAISSGATVLVTVDNSLPMTGPYCQVTTLNIQAST